MPDAREYRQLQFTRPPGSTELLLVRHGESAPMRVGEPVPSVDGHGDPPLDPVGEIQAERVGERLAVENISSIYVTILQRTSQTAAPLAKRLGIEPAVEPELREVHLGEWESGPFRKYMEERHPLTVRLAAEQRWDVIPGAEPAEAFEARVRLGIERIVHRHPDETVAVFTHGGVIGQLLALATGAQRFAFNGADNGSISQLVVTDERWILRRFNDTAHLHPRFTTLPEPLT